jgi:hypothetical protein
MSELHTLLRVFADDQSGRRKFTLHLDFLAVDKEQARLRAEQYARALNMLRPEVDCFTARLSADGDWRCPMAVFCGSPGPHEMDVCVGSAGHPGLHDGPGASGRWGDDQVPRAPDTAEGLGQR